jgi:hypothetical protein
MAKDPNQRYATTIELADAARDAITVPIPRLVPSPGPAPAASTLIEEPAAPTPATQPAFAGNLTNPTVAATPTQMAPTELAPPPRPGPRTAPLAPSPAISPGKFACIVCGVVLVSISMAYLLLPKHYYDDMSKYYYGVSTMYAFYGLFAFGTIPGIVLLVLGRGRAHPDRTIWGCALVSLGLAAGLIFELHASRGIEVYILTVVGVLLILVSMFLRRPSRAIARGCLFYGAAIVTLVVIELILAYLRLLAGLHPARYSMSAAAGLVLVVGGAIGWKMRRLGANREASQAPRLY